MRTVGETCALVKFSAKRENLLRTIREQLEEESDDRTIQTGFLL